MTVRRDWITPPFAGHDEIGWACTHHGRANAHRPPPPLNPGSSNHLERVARQVRHVQDALQFRLHQRLPRGIDAAPLAERRYHPRRHLAVHRIERDDRVGQEPVAAARRVVEPHRIAGGEAADQRAHPVGVAQVVIRMPRPARAPRPACRARCEVAWIANHLSSTSASSRQRAWNAASAASRSAQSMPASTASAASTSVMLRPASNCALASRTPSAPSGREIGQAGVAQRAPADRRAVDAVGPGVGQPVVGGAQRVAQRRADRRAHALAHRVDRVDIDHRHLVGEEGLARQRQRLGGEGRVGVGPRQGRRHRLDQCRRPPAAFRRVATRRPRSSSSAGRVLLAGSQRTNGSVSCAARKRSRSGAHARTASPAPRSRAAATAPAALARRRR